MSDFNVISCSDKCSRIRRLTDDEFQRLARSMNHFADTLYYCGYCNHNRNEWIIGEMLFDDTNEVAVTPCCHTEATEALKCYCLEGACEADEESLESQKRHDYIYTQTGRY